MNKPVTYNKAVIPNSPIAIVDLQNNDNQAIVNSTIMIAELKDCKPIGVATYKTTAEMPEELRKALPDIEELKKLLLKRNYYDDRTKHQLRLQAEIHGQSLPASVRVLLCECKQGSGGEKLGKSERNPLEIRNDNRKINIVLWI